MQKRNIFQTPEQRRRFPVPSLRFRLFTWGCPDLTPRIRDENCFNRLRLCRRGMEGELSFVLGCAATISNMKPLKEVYPNVDDECPSFYDYSPLLASFGYEELLSVDDNDYQGDSRVLFKDSERIGLLIFGWGSCSGCDALQACSSFNEVEVLRAQLHEQIKWFESKAEARNYFLTHDWAGDYHGNSEETVRFIAQAMPLFA